MYERVSDGTRHPVERTINELVELARTTEFEGMSAAKHPYVRQKLAQFASEALCLRLSRYRSLTSQLQRQSTGTGKLLWQATCDRTQLACRHVRGRTARTVCTVGAQFAGSSRERSLALSGVTCTWTHHRCGLKRDSAQHHRRAGPEAAEGVGGIKPTKAILRISQAGTRS